MQTALDERWFPARCLYLSGAICRENLLVEAEAVIGAGSLRVSIPP